MKGLWIRFAVIVFVAAVVISPSLLAVEVEAESSLFASLTQQPCDAAAAVALEESLAEFDFTPVEELPVTPVEPTEKAVTCGSWTYNGCCISQTKYRRRCQFNQAEWWYEYKCQGVCVM